MHSSTFNLLIESQTRWDIHYFYFCKVVIIHLCLDHHCSIIHWFKQDFPRVDVSSCQSDSRKWTLRSTNNFWREITCTQVCRLPGAASWTNLYTVWMVRILGCHLIWVPLPQHECGYPTRPFKSPPGQETRVGVKKWIWHSTANQHDHVGNWIESHTWPLSW